MKLCLSLMLAAVSILFAPQSLQAQDNSGDLGVGMPENGVFDGSVIDNVQIQNQNLHIHIPLLTIKGRGISLSYQYLWDAPAYRASLLGCDSTTGFCRYRVTATRNPTGTGWRFTNSANWNLNVTVHGGPQCGTHIAMNGVSGVLAIDPEGTAHNLLGFSAPDGQTGCYTTAQRLYSDDGSGVVGTVDQTQLLPKQILLKNGTYIDPGYKQAGWTNAGVLVRDANGNQIILNNDNHTVTDTLGRLQPAAPDAAGHLTYYDSNGNLQTITVVYQSVSVKSNQCSYQASPSDACSEFTGTVNAVQQIILPNGLKYTFDYTPIPNKPTLGQPNSMTLPTGAVVTWDWQEVEGGLQVMSRTVTANGTAAKTSYIAVSPGVGINCSVCIVHDALGNETRHTFTTLNPTQCFGCGSGSPPNRETLAEYFQGTAATGKLIKSVQTDYSSSGIPLPIRVTTRIDANTANSVNKVETDWDYVTVPNLNFSWQNPIEVREFDFGVGTPGGLLRRTDYSYLHLSNSSYQSLNIAQQPTSKLIYDSASNQKAQTSYGYDTTTLSSTSGVPGHDSSFSSAFSTRGNLTSQSDWLDQTNSGSVNAFLPATTKTYDDLGNLLSSTDPLGNKTTFDYNDDWGSSGQVTACLPTTNSRAFRTDVTNALTHRTHTAYYTCTGQVQSVQGPNDLAAGRPGTGYSYDSVMRPLTISFPDGGQTCFNYHGDALPLTVTKSVLLTGTTCVGTSGVVSTSSVRDDLGRVKQTSVDSDPLGADLIDTTYDLLGRKASQSNPHRSSASSTDGITQYTYDVLGRITDLTEPDHSIVHTDYAGSATTVTDEAGHQRRSAADGLGRLVELDEPTGNPVQANNYVTLQSDSNFVLYDQSGTVRWQSGTAGSNAPNIYMQDDGNLVLYSLRWSAGTYTAPVAGSYPQSACSIGTYLTPGELLPSGKCITSPSGEYFLLMNTDGNLFIYDWVRGAGTWGPGTQGHPGAYAIFQTDGNFVVYDVNGNFLWNSGTSGTNAERLDLLDDGRLMIWKSVWSTGTSDGHFNGTVITHPSCDAGQGTGWTGVLGSGRCFVSPNGRFELLMQSDGNLVIYDRSVTPASAIWATNTAISAVDPSVAMRTLYTYDALGNLTCVEQHGTAASGTGCASPSSSDATSPWRVRRFTYDSLSRLLQAANPESGLIKYSYDADNNMLQKISPAPNQLGSAVQTLSYCYDALNRVTSEAYSAQTCSSGLLPAGTAVVSYFYDQSSFNGLPIANGIGRRTGISDQAGSGGYSYDPLGRIASEQRTIAGITKNLSYTYNFDGSIATMTYPSGAVVKYTPDAAGKVSAVTDNGNSIQYVANASYAPDGSIAGFVSGGGITNSFSYNQRLQPVNMAATAGSPSQTLFSIDYDFHVGNGNNGNVWGITNNKDATRSQTFTYDALNRLISAKNAGTDCTKKLPDGNFEYWGNNYAYDGWGNLLQKTVMQNQCSGENLIVTAAVNNRIQTAGYVYDAAGNMTNDGSGHNFTYDADNRITALAGYSYTYDADGNRVVKTTTATPATGTLYWYMALGIVAETDLSGSLKSEYVFFNGKRVARKDFPGNSVFYYFSDHLKTVALETDSQGTIKDESDFYPWGGELHFTDSTDNHYKFTGKERDTETGLDYFGARYYANTLGRFTKADPVHFQASMLIDPQKFNLYAYVRNNPLQLVDPDGKAVQLPDDDTKRAEVLEGLRDAVGKQAGSYLYDNAVTKTDANGNTTTEHYVGIYTNGPDGKGPSFQSINQNSAELAAVIGSQGVVHADIVPSGTLVKNDDGQIGAIGPIPGSPGASYRLHGQMHISVLDPSTYPGELPGSVMSDGNPAKIDQGMLWAHEMGHTAVEMGVVIPGPSSAAALTLENNVRKAENPGAATRTKEHSDDQ